jgi:predicted DNA-binding transcriptional regulator AlpA
VAAGQHGNAEQTYGPVRSNEHRVVFCKERGAVNVVFYRSPSVNVKNSEINEASGASKTAAVSDSSEGIPSMPKRLLTKRELAAVLSVSERTIDNWLAQKRIPRLRLSARMTRFSLPRVETSLARYEIKEVGRRQ